MSILIATGRLGSDAEVRTTQGGTKVCQFSVADEIGWGDKKRVQWLKCLMFGERAEKLAPHLTKGSIVEIHGTPECDAWTDKAKGDARGQIKVLVSDVKLHGGARRDEPERVVGARRATGGASEEIPW